jgi:D-alanine-D-alanine ligase
MRVGLTYNLKPDDAAAHDDAFEELDSLETIEALERALRANGHEPVRLGYGEALLDAQVDKVFNIAEGFGGRGRESQVPATLELLGIPCTGSDPLTIGITLDKALARTYAKAHGIPVAGSERFPLFVKPACEGSSMGITSASLCRTPAELHDAVARLQTYGPVLVEEFLPGDEYTAGIVQGQVIGVMQVVPRGGEPDFIYSLDVKRDYTNRVDYRLVDAPDVADVALRVWRAFGLRDVARVDIRRDRDGVPCFLEVNPLPGVHPVNSDLIILARLAGIGYEELIGRIIGGMRDEGGGMNREAARPPQSSLIPHPSSLRAKLVVAYNDDAHLKPHLNEIERRGEAESGEAAREIAEILGAELYPVRDVREALRHLQDAECVINLCEGVLGKPGLEMHFALALEMLGIPFTGCDPIAVGLCMDKALVKRLLEVHGISTPRGVAVTRGSDLRELPAERVIVKPSREDAGVGIERDAVCATLAGARQRVDYVARTYRQPALVEEFIDGREFNQAMFGDTLLPPGEILFAGELAPEARVVGWKAKWDSGSAEDRATVNRTPAVIDDTLRRDLADLCRRAEGVLSLRGYCRMDVRQRAAGDLCIVDINPNPDIGSQTGFRKALEAAGIGFRDFLGQLMMAARSRNARRRA